MQLELCCVGERSLRVCENANYMCLRCAVLVQSKKRGLSLEEKREKMLQIFYDSHDFYLVCLPPQHYTFL